MNNIYKLIVKGIRLFKTKYLYKIGAIGEKSIIINPLQIDNPNKIKLGNHVTVLDYTWLMGPSFRECPGLIIDDYSVIGHFCHIIANKSVHIGNHVLLADRVFISDCTHGYEIPEVPIIDQSIVFLNPVYIGDGSWIGENVCVCGASIGNHCVIGANSVVTSDIPDYCIAVGSPARVIKRYDFQTNEWMKVGKE